MLNKLYRNMSVEEFEKGYFYATELKAFAKELGIDVGTLRKNEVEDHIKARLSGSDDTPLPKGVPNRKTSGSRDRLSPDSYIVNYVSDKATKTFLKEEISKRDPDLKDKSGQWYWLNDWRKEQIRNNRKITYRELIDRLYELMTTKGRLPRIPSTRFNNFITDFLVAPENEGATRQEAMDEWERLKKIPVQKNYQEYKKFLNKTA
ncbi:hypothetical protein PSI15_02915 [Xenorhabdus sp. PR6a]|uniref:hypothetical protein n=1 Tax=Xenorhabdus sp. PR6a TaxID=3025877 RepID=UPI002358FB54|nr:hypothetical protein [Xenorhabdus sp. PR6a]MDC9580531.1 hypothetical protein [Xenorhabdus sp. PR6a]